MSVCCVYFGFTPLILLFCKVCRLSCMLMDVELVTRNYPSIDCLLSQTAALWCCKTGHVDVNARNNADYTPLHESCAHGHTAVAECLIFYGADINAVSRLDGAR